MTTWLRSCDMNAICDACKFTMKRLRFAASPITFISHERKQVVIQFLSIHFFFIFAALNF